MKAHSKNSKFDLLAFAMVRTSPEFTRWMMGMGPRPHLHSPENISRTLDFHVGLMAEATAGLTAAKDAVQAKQLSKAKRLVEKSFTSLEVSISRSNDLLVLLAELQRELKGQAQ